MRRDAFVAAALGGLLLLGAPQPAASLGHTPQAQCCTVMDLQAMKYYQKHIKLANKCTARMQESNDPNGERCDDGFDAVKNDPNADFLIDKFRAKFIKKMKKKCARKLLVAFENVGDVEKMPACGCPETDYLEDQIICKLELLPNPADSAVCGIVPLRKNSNRGTSSPPNESKFCLPPIP